MTLSIECHANGPLRQNCYVVGNGAGEALIVDPGSDADGIAGMLERHELQPRAIINTHGHFDHICAVADLMARFEVPFYLHGGDGDLLRRANLYTLVFGSREPITVPEISFDLQNLSSPFSIGAFKVDWTETPGHTPGGVCFVIENSIFTGDTILAGKIGQMKLPGADDAALVRSLDRLDGLSRKLSMYPGHGRPIPLGEGLDKVRNRQVSTV